jgi:cell division protein FtsB
MTQQAEVTERRRAPGSSPGQRRPPQPRTRAPAGTGVPAGRPGPVPARTRPPAARPAQRRGGTGAAPGVARPARPPRPGQRRPVSESRTRFVFLIVALLGGGLLCLLMVNTILAAGAFKITALQRDNVALAQRDQALEAQIAAEEAPSALAQRARALGMVAPPLTHFLDLKTGRIISQPRRVPGVPTVPGYTP